MFKSLLTRLQSCLPQHFLSQCIGKLANSTTPWIKDTFIRRFIHHYQVDMHTAVEENPAAYESFNAFFIRLFKPTLRPITPDPRAIASPADGSIAQIGHVTKQTLLQAKQFYFTLDTLFAGHQTVSQYFYNGSYATFYLAPYNYHRVHMPLTGTLLQSIYVPGRLFSVNRMTSELIPNLYSRNERFITLFETEVGVMAVILVGALMVGHIQMQWMNQPVRTNQIDIQHYPKAPPLIKGSELGHFHMGSTVILLYQKDAIEWLPTLYAGSTIQFGQAIGMIK